MQYKKEQELKEIETAYELYRQQVAVKLQAKSKVTDLDTRYIYHDNDITHGIYSLRAIYGKLSDKPIEVINAKMLMSRDEWNYLGKVTNVNDELSFTQGLKPDLVEKKDGIKLVAKCPDGINAHNTMIALAIHELYESGKFIEMFENVNEDGTRTRKYKDHRKHVFFDEQGAVYLIPYSLADKATTYFKPNLERFRYKEEVSFEDKLMKVIDKRFNPTSNHARAIKQQIASLKHDSDFKYFINPSATAIRKRLDEIIRGEITEEEYFTVDDFVNRLTYGKEEDIEIGDMNAQNERNEPYREKVLRQLPLSIVVSQMGGGYRNLDESNEWIDFTNKGTKVAPIRNDNQSMLVLQGKQGIGKSTFVLTMGLGHTYKIDDFSSNSDQEVIYKRATACTIEISENQALGKKGAAKIKTFIDEREANFNPKFENGIRTIYYRGVMITTINDTDILKDMTGARRLWPLFFNKNQLHSITMDEVCTMYALLYRDILNGKVDFDLEMIETEEEFDYKDEVFGQTDAKLDILLTWFKGQLEENPAKTKITKILRGDNLFLGRRKELQRVINTDEFLSGVYADKLTGWLAQLSSFEAHKQVKVDGKNARMMMVDVKELSEKLYDDGEILKNILKYKPATLNEIRAMLVRDMRIRHIPDAYIAKLLGYDPEKFKNMVFTPLTDQEIKDRYQ
ncbi:virulence-associated E family protein [Ligilactobacillus equi]|uniref:VapE domain-containing protein n=1 Tax=Ligilactobacillus equi TaxID=137357 RepID=UPI002ED61FAA